MPPYTLTNRAAAEEYLYGLNPRVYGWRVVEAADADLVLPVLRRASVTTRLLAAGHGGPVMVAAVRRTFGEDPGAWAVAGYLGDTFPPEGQIPVVPPALVPAVREIAMGEPGAQVRHGLFPRFTQKLARLALAAQDEYPADLVRYMAEHAYDPVRPYHGHDAVACALVHPGVDAADLVHRVINRNLAGRGWRSRRKTNRLLAWGRRRGYLPDAEGCRCGHDRHLPPTDSHRALRLAWGWSALRRHLDPVVADPDRWLAVLRCERCGRYWAQGSMTSGQADLAYGWPIDTDDPAAWLAAATPLAF